MKNIIAGAAIAGSAMAVLGWSTGPRAQGSPSSVAQPATSPAPPADNGLGELASMTFGCPKAALNAAAREAAKMRSQGTYQFSYFKILNDSHHATYEVRFTSNFTGEKALNYCVAIYCQQGWDPRTTKTTVTRLGATTDAKANTCHH